MEEVDIDKVMEIPDTPDRVSGRQMSGAQFGRASGSSSASHSRNSDIMNIERFNQLGIRSLVADEVYHRNKHGRPPRSRIIVDEPEQSDTRTTSSLENYHPAEDASLFRRTARVKDSRPETRPSRGATYTDKGKALCSKIPSKSHVSRENGTSMKLSEQSEHNNVLNMGFSRGASNNQPSQQRCKGQISFSSASSLSPVSSTSMKFTEPSEHDHILNMAFPRGASNNHPSQPRCKGQISFSSASSLSPVSSRILDSASKGKEKLGGGPVNGACATLNRERAIGVSSSSQHEANKNMSTSLPSVILPRVSGRKRLVRNGCISPCNIANRAQVRTDSRQVGSGSAETSQCQQLRSSDPSHVEIRNIVAVENESSNFLDLTRSHHSTRNEHVSTSSRASTSGPVFGNGLDNSDSAVNRGAELGGWRMTRNRDSMQKTPTPVSATSRPNGRQVVGSKRLRKHHGESSSSVYDDSEILFLGSSQGSPRLQGHQLDSFSRHNELSHTQEVGSVDADESEARARQLEADEMLARELQEQLYHEMPVYGEGEDEDGLPGASSYHQPALHAGRQTQPRAQAQTRQNPPIRRGTQARAPTSRVSQLRNRVNRSTTAVPRRRTRIPVALYRDRHLQFPLDMNLDMRLDILEALEAAVGGDSRSDTRHIMNLQRDFNENDYDLLLSLDDNNRGQGASVNQINCLPESVVRCDNLEESCAICLETPSMGETIRHLPCFHKFHKDCIDPWLGRQKLCPVCKSSIT